MKASVAMITPVSPWMGSSMTPTVLSVISASTDARSLILAFGKPGTLGSNKSRNCDLPDADIVASVRPWKEFSSVMIS